MPLRVKLVVTAFMAVALGASAQTAVRPQFDAFEVATIKPADSDARGRWIRMQSADRFEAHNHAVRTLIAAAYNLNPRAVSGGPSWVDSEHWDILAKTPGDVRPTLDEQMSMLRQLLSERFGLTFHRQPKQLPVYTLTIARGGSKLKESTVSPDATPDGPPPLVFILTPTVVSLPARYSSMSEFASVLQRSPLDRPVVDQTGLSGRYDFDLEFAPDERLWGGILPQPENPDKPDLFKAVQEQLGLQLKATTGPVNTIVIDSIEKPSGN